MPIHRKHNLTFIHIPKTGGLLLKNYLGFQKKVACGQ